MVPPRDEISWAQIVDKVFLAELDILKDTRQDIRRMAWTDPSHREAAALYFNIKRAKEEIERLNVEIRRLLTSMHDTHYDFLSAISTNVLTNPPLAYELHRQWLLLSKENEVVARRLLQTSLLEGFTGRLETGHRCGRMRDIPAFLPPPLWSVTVNKSTRSRSDEMDSEDSEWEDEEREDVAVQVSDFVANLASNE